MVAAALVGWTSLAAVGAFYVATVGRFSYGALTARHDDLLLVVLVLGAVALLVTAVLGLVVAVTGAVLAGRCLRRLEGSPWSWSGVAFALPVASVGVALFG